MNSRMLLASLAVLGVAGGALAGLDAAGAVNGFYTAPREERYQPLPPAAPVPTYENRTFAAAPPAGTVWGQEVGRDERAYFADTVQAELPPELPDVDDWRPEPPVRVHRVSREVEPVIVEPPEAAPEPVDGWVDAPGPERLPSAG